LQLQNTLLISNFETPSHGSLAQYTKQGCEIDRLSS